MAMDSPQPKKPLKCLVKIEDCKSPNCQSSMQICPIEEMSSHCYAMTQYNSTSEINDLLYAGCWSGQKECNPPLDLLEDIRIKIKNEGNHDTEFLDRLKSYNLSAQLRDPIIQKKCIGYATSPNDQTFCCCQTDACNTELAFVEEQNPFHVFSKSMNPTVPNLFDDKETEGGFDWFISSRDLTMVCMSGLVCLLIISIVLSLFFCLKRSSKKRKDSPYFSGVYYSRANSINDLPNSNSGNFNHELTLIHNSDSFQLNAILFNQNAKNLDSTNPKPILPPDLNSTAVPNIQIPPTNPTTTNFTYQSAIVLKKPRNSITSDTHIDHLNNAEFNNSTPDLALPSRLRACDIKLISKLVQGQFSSVWRARCHNCLEDKEAPEYAIKVFSSHQKTAWSNEKDIYNSMQSLDLNILKFFGSDISEVKPDPQLPFLTSNDYWLITEYHPFGSLHDFLKQSLITWSQMVSIAHCFFEGLAFLHSDNAIAHRDLKSKNILVKSDGRTCCIGDFGLALKLQSKNKLSSVEIRSKVGTKRYMSPELIEGAIAFTKETFLRIDVYASALVLWEIVSRGDFYDETCAYKLPFEDEVGFNPNLEEMKVIVVDNCQRPVIKEKWLINNQLKIICQTIEESWDIDLDARISAECAAARLRKIYKTTLV